MWVSTTINYHKKTMALKFPLLENNALISAKSYQKRVSITRFRNQLMNLKLGRKSLVPSKTSEHSHNCQQFILAHSEDKNMVGWLHRESVFIHARWTAEHPCTVRHRTNSTIERSIDGKHDAALAFLFLLL